MTDYAARRVMMVDTQVRPSDVTKYPIIEAMLAVAREAYVPDAKREAAYVGANIEIAPGRYLLEARSLAKMLDALNIQPDEKVLVVGCGLAYSVAVTARMAGSVLGLEADAALAEQAQKNIADQGVGNAAVRAGALEKGAADAAPFQVILIEGGVEDVPAALLAQLAEGGRIGAIFMKGALGVAMVGHNSSGRLAWRQVFNATAPVLNGFAAERGFAL